MLAMPRLPAVRATVCLGLMVLSRCNFARDSRTAAGMLSTRGRGNCCFKRTMRG